MAQELERIRHRLETEGQKTMAYLEALPSEAWQQQVYQAGPAWRVHEVLAHFVSAETTFARYLEQVLGGGPGVPRDLDIDAFNAQAVAELALASKEDLQAAFAQARAQTVRLVGGLTESDLQRPSYHPWLGDTALGEILQLIYRHTMLHLRDVRRALESGAPLPAGAQAADA